MEQINKSTEISIVIPTYNRGYLITQAINSIKSQSFVNWELIIVDDCSTDNTAEIINSLSQQDPRIRYHKLEKNSGANAARNVGVKLACSNLISFLDSDDEYHHLNLENQYKMFSSSKVLALCYVGVDYYNGNTLTFTVHPKVRGNLEKFLFLNLKGLGASNSGLTVRKDVINEVGGFDEAMSSQQDLDLFVRIARNHYIDYIDDCNTKVYENSNDRISDNLNSVLKGEIQFMSKHELRIRELGLYHHVARKLARKYALYAKDLPNAFRMIFKAIKYKPTYIYAYIYIFKLVFLYFKK